jgi:hypothetical protein
MQLFETGMRTMKKEVQVTVSITECIQHFIISGKKGGTGITSISDGKQMSKFNGWLRTVACW